MRQRWEAWGLAPQDLDAAGLREFEPEIEGVSALFLPSESQVRPPRLLKALLAVCKEKQVHFLSNSELQRFERDGSRIVSLSTADSVVVADRFCITSGCRTEAITELLATRISVMPVRGQIALYKSTPGLLKHIVNIGRCYITPRLDGRVLVGSTQEEAGFDSRCTPKGIESLQLLVDRYCPKLRGFELEKTWAGLRPCVSDSLPIIGRIPNLENVWMATGHCRSGIQLAPGTAAVVGAEILEQQPPIDVAALGPQRLL